MKRRTLDSAKLRRTMKKNRNTEGFCGSGLIYLKILFIWVVVMIVDFLLDFRFEYLWPSWLLLRSIYDSFRYQGAAFSIFFVCITVTSDMICFIFIPVQWLFLLAGTCVWVQYVWHTDRGICLPTITLWLLFIYIEASVRLKELKSLPFSLDLCRPFAAHCIGYPVVTLGFGVKTYVSYRLRWRKQREVAKENEIYFQILKEALPEENDLQRLTDNDSAGHMLPIEDLISNGVIRSQGNATAASNLYINSGGGGASSALSTSMSRNSKPSTLASSSSLFASIGQQRSVLSNFWCPSSQQQQFHNCLNSQLSDLSPYGLPGRSINETTVTLRRKALGSSSSSAVGGSSTVSVGVSKDSRHLERRGEGPTATSSASSWAFTSSLFFMLRDFLWRLLSMAGIFGYGSNINSGIQSSTPSSLRHQFWMTRGDDDGYDSSCYRMAGSPFGAGSLSWPSTYDDRRSSMTSNRIVNGHDSDDDSHDSYDSNLLPTMGATGSNLSTFKVTTGALTKRTIPLGAASAKANRKQSALALTLPQGSSMANGSVSVSTSSALKMSASSSSFQQQLSSASTKDVQQQSTTSTSSQLDQQQHNISSKAQEAKDRDVLAQVELDLERSRHELKASRSKEQDLRRQVNELSNNEKVSRNELLQLKQQHEQLQTKFQNLTKARQQDKENVAALEKRVCEEQKLRNQLEQQLKQEKKQQQKKLDEALNFATNKTSISNSVTTKVDCTETCKQRRRELEQQLKQIRREIQQREEILARRDQELLAYKEYKEANDIEAMMNALTTAQDKNQRLELSLSAETRIKLDLFSALGDTKRQLEIITAQNQRKEHELEELRRRLHQLSGVGSQQVVGCTTTSSPTHMLYNGTGIPASTVSIVQQQQSSQHMTPPSSATSVVAGVVASTNVAPVSPLESTAFDVLSQQMYNTSYGLSAMNGLMFEDCGIGYSSMPFVSLAGSGQQQTNGTPVTDQCKTGGTPLSGLRFSPSHGST